MVNGCLKIFIVKMLQLLHDCDNGWYCSAGLCIISRMFDDARGIISWLRRCWLTSVRVGKLLNSIWNHTEAVFIEYVLPASLMERFLRQNSLIQLYMAGWMIVTLMLVFDSIDWGCPRWKSFWIIEESLSMDRSRSVILGYVKE